MSRGRARQRAAVFLWHSMTLGLLACQPQETASPDPATSDRNHVESTPANDQDDPKTWVRTWQPQKTRQGFILDLWSRRIPTLFDRAGRVVHRWPEARLKSRVRLEPDGSILGLARGPAVHRYAWSGELLWQYRFEDELPHHDVIRLSNGNVLVITRREAAHTDDLVEIDPAADRIAWRWRSEDHLGALLERAAPVDANSPTHFNSVQELPPNHWHENGDQRFRPGHLLVSARNLNTIFIVDRESGRIVWDFTEELDLQHEASMVAHQDDRAGLILVLSNGTRNRYRYRQSALLAIDPTRREIVRRFSSPTFFTSTGGVQQPLADGHTLLTSTRGGRVFEIDASGTIVWEWTPAFDPTRASWIAPDAAPQLRDLALAEPVVRKPPTRFVERRAYRFGRRSDVYRQEIANVEQLVLRETALCSRVHLPHRALVELRFRSRRGNVGPVRFLLSARALSESELSTLNPELWTPDRSPDDPMLFDVTVEEPGWQLTTVDLSHLSDKSAVLCLEASEVSDAPEASEASEASEPAGQWLLPAIRSAGQGRRPTPEDREQLTDAEAEAARRHLEAMGYVH